ncbi:MAG: hypothetical protein FJZ61_03735 [Chlamydiae bacterium]|nr:hypothetical protein [Chlamydiota bacterium]
MRILGLDFSIDPRGVSKTPEPKELKEFDEIKKIACFILFNLAFVGSQLALTAFQLRKFPLISPVLLCATAVGSLLFYNKCVSLILDGFDTASKP